MFSFQIILAFVTELTLKCTAQHETTTVEFSAVHSCVTQIICLCCPPINTLVIGGKKSQQGLRL